MTSTDVAIRTAIATVISELKHHESHDLQVYFEMIFLQELSNDNTHVQNQTLKKKDSIIFPLFVREDEQDTPYSPCWSK
jgi:hypothetical protein